MRTRHSKLFFLMLLTATFILHLSMTSCSDDDNDSMPSEEWIIGDWEGDHHVIYYEQDGKTIKSETHYDVVLRLNEDGSIGGNAFRKNSWRIEGSTFYVDNISYEFVRLNSNSFKLTNTIDGKYPAINTFTFTRIKE